MSARISVRHIEDCEPTRALVQRCLARQPDFLLQPAFADAESALIHLTESSDALPTVLLVDWHLGEGRMDGNECIRQVKTLFPQICCLLLTSVELDPLPAEAIRSGADGFLYKSDPISALPDRIRAALAGQHPISERAAQKLIATLSAEATAANTALSKLTAREREILLYVGGGPIEKEAATHFGRSVHTINNQLQSAYRKLGVHNLPEAMTRIRGGSKA